MKYSSRWHNPYNRGMGRNPEIPVEQVLAKTPIFKVLEHIKALINTQEILRKIGEKK